MSHLVAVHLPWDKDRILIIGGQTYNKKTQNFENVKAVYKFDPFDEKLKACQDLAAIDRFQMGMAIADSKNQVAALGEKFMHLFDGTSWKTISRDADLPKLTAPTEPPTTVTQITCLLYTSPSPRDRQKSRMPSSA